MLTEIGLDRVAGSKLAWINVSREFLLGRRLVGGRERRFAEEQLVADDLETTVEDRLAGDVGVAHDSPCAIRHSVSDT